MSDSSSSAPQSDLGNLSNSSNLPSSSNPTPASTPPQSQPPTPSSTSRPPQPSQPTQPTPKQPTPADHFQPQKARPFEAKRFIYLGSFIVLVISVSLLSFFFYTRQRQPKTSSSAAQPRSKDDRPLAETTPNFIPTKSSGFSDLLGRLLSPEKSSSDVLPPTPTLTPAPTLTPTPIPTPGPRIIYEITAENDRFNPDRISANLGDTVSLFIYAADKIYDVEIPRLGLSKTIYPGDRKFLEFQATAEGQFTFSCKNCPPNSSGTVTVKK